MNNADSFRVTVNLEYLVASFPRLTFEFLKIELKNCSVRDMRLKIGRHVEFQNSAF